MDKDKQIKKKFEEFQEKLKKTALGINYIQEKYKKRFVKLAQEEYGNDYGVTLKELLKIYDGFYPTGHEEIEEKIDLLADEIRKINEKLEPKKSEIPEGYHYSADKSRLIKDS